MLTTETASLGLVDPFSDGVMGSWYLLRTRSRHEKIVADNLASRGVLHYLPLMSSVRYYGKRKAIVDVPLFPGYVFLRGVPEDAYDLDRRGRLAQIIQVKDQRMLNDELKNIAFALQCDGQLAQYPYLQKGVPVEVRSGPFRGLRGIIEDLSKRNRLILRVDILGRAVSLEVDAGLLDVI